MCMFCETDRDGYVKVLNRHICIWKNKLRITIYGKLWEIDINFCPMCGRQLKEKQNDKT